MKLAPRREDNPDITLTPLIDVVFLLLIFFMVSTTFSQRSELQVELPEASAEAEPREDKSIEIVIDAKGRFHVGGLRLLNTRLDTLKRALQDTLGDAEEAPPLVINADGQAPHQAVVTAMDAAQQLGLTRLSFATAQPDDE